MVTLATVVVPVSDDRPLKGFIGRLFAQNVKNLEIAVVSPVARRDALEAAQDAGHDLPIVNLSIDGPPGRAFNAIAKEAHGHYLITVSPAARFPDDRWLNRLLEPFTDDRIAAVSGCDYDPERVSVQEPSYEPTLADFLCAPRFGIGFGNAAFRLDRVRERPFDEHLRVCADKEWTYRLLQAGYRIRLDHEARVDLPDVEHDEAALRSFWEEQQAIASFLEKTDRAQLLWKWAWSRKNPGEILTALRLGPHLKRQRSLLEGLPEAMEVRSRFKRSGPELARPAK